MTRAPGGHPKGFVFSEEHGERVVKFVEKYCHHYKGEWAGQLMVLSEWQKQIIRCVFGWLKPDPDNAGKWVRRFRTAYIEVARKNGKSTLTGGLGLYLTTADNEPGAEVYSTATKKDQAAILWRDAKEMVEQSPALAKRLTPWERVITCEKTKSKFLPLGADSATLDGLNPHGNLVDELHAHPTRKLWDVMKSAMGARRQPLTLAITTAGYFDITSIGFEQHTYAQNVLDKVISDDSYFAFIAAADAGDDHFAMTSLEKANPNIDISCKRDYLLERQAEARNVPSAKSEYLTKHLNVWTTESAGWLSLDAWKACEPKSITREAHEARFDGMPCRAGLDLASKLDLAALVLEFEIPDGAKPEEKGRKGLVVRCYLPEERIAELAKKGQPQFETWVREGWLVSTPGAVTDFDFIERDLLELADRYTITEIGFDPNNATHIATQLTSKGFAMTEVRQGYAMNEGIKAFEADVIGKKISHGNHPVLTWCVNNVIVTKSATDQVQLDKAKAKGKIDAIVAAVIARMVALPAGDGEDPYADRGFLSL